MNKDLTPRQWALYKLLKNNPDRYMTQYEIAERLYGEYIDRETFHDNYKRKAMTNDIRAINNSEVIQKIIISTPEGIKIASREEFERYIKAEYASIFRKLSRTRKKAQKAGLDGQVRFVFGGERDTIEAFADNINRLKAARLNKGLRLIEVVGKLRKLGEKHIDVATLSKLENGYFLPTNALLMKLARIYDTEPHLLSGGYFITEESIS